MANNKGRNDDIIARFATQTNQMFVFRFVSERVSICEEILNGSINLGFAYLVAQFAPFFLCNRSRYG